MKVFKYFAILLVFTLLFACCKGKYEKHIVNDVAKENIVLLQNSDTTKGIFSISLLIRGNLDGNALIIIKDGVSYKKEYKINEGIVELNINEDWYSPKCIFEYYPDNVNEGELKIDYKFFEL